MEITANAIQTVAANANVLFTDVVVPSNCSTVYRQGSGLITLRAVGAQTRARFRVSFGGNVALPTGGTVGPISLAIAVNGEPVATTTMISTPAAVEEFNNVFSAIFLDIPCGCCSQISVSNITDQSIDIQNANLIVERVA